MTKLVALKRIRYPRGVGGQDRNPGDEFEALSDRDAKALTLIRVAKVVEAPRRGRPPKTETRELKAEAPEPQVTPWKDWPSEEKSEPVRRYRRRDMNPED